jgi:fibronectin-binding autotransporter adhesin
MNVPSTPVRRPALKFGILAASSVAISILTGSIEAQIIPAQATTRTWDAATGAVGTFNWGDAVNWNGPDIVPGINDIAAFSAPNAVITVDLGGVREVGALYLGTAGGSANYLFQNGTLVTNAISQNQDDPNALSPTALVQSKNGGVDLLSVSVSANTLQLQGQVTSGGITKYGNGVLRLGTSGTDFNNAINGDITIYGGTLTAAAGATNGTNNPLAGSGDVVIGNSGVTLGLTASGSLATGAEYDFVRNIRAGNNSFTLSVGLAGGSDTTDPNMRAGTLSIGNATMTVNQTNGFRAMLDGVNIAAGATATRVQINTPTFFDGLSGDAASNFYKRGGSDLDIRVSAAAFSGDVYLAEGTTRFISTVAGVNPLGGSDSTVYFANGYGVNALDGGQTLGLRSNTALDFGSNIVFKPGVTIGRIDVNNNGSGSGQTLALGDVNLSGKLLRVIGANQRLGLDNVTVDAGATANFEASGADVIVSGNLSVGAGATFNKLGGNMLTLSADNSTTILGSINVRAGNLIGTVAGSLGSRPIEVGDPVPNSAGFFANSARLQVNHADALGNATGTDVTVKIGGIVDINAVPNGDDIFAIEAGGRIQGDATQLGALNVGTTLLLSPDAIIAHEAPGAATGTVTGLANNASVYYGVANTAGAANTLPNMGAGTPWKGLMGDSIGARTVQGVDAVTPAVLNVEGGNNDPDSIEIYVGGMSDQTLNLGTTAAGDGAFQWNSVSTQKATLAIRGVVGVSGLGLVPGGRVAFNETAVASGLITHVDKIVIQQGSLILPIVGAQGGVPIEIQNGGSLDLGNLAGNIIDGAVTVKSGGVFFFNDNQVLGGTGAITFESGSKLDISGAAPATFFTAATNPISFAGANNITVRFAASDITDLDNRIPDVGATYVVSGGATAALLGQSNVSVTTNTQAAGITIDGGILTNDGTSRGFTGPINLNNSNFTVAATRGTTLALTSSIATTGNVQIGSATTIDGRDKNSNPDRLSGLGLLDQYSGSPQVVFLGAFNVGGDVTATSTHLGFADASTNIGGDLIFNGNALYLDGGGPLSGGNSTKGDLTARLTDGSGLVANRVADNIILGNNARVELSVTGGVNHTITQPFVVTGQVSPVDKRTFFVDRAAGTATTNALFENVLVKAGAQIGFDENGVGVRTNLRLEGNVTLVRNHDDYDLRNIVKEPGAPANVTVFAGEPAFGWDDATETLVNGSNATLNTSVDGTIPAGVTVDIIRSTMNFEQNAVLNGVVRAQTAPARGDALIVSRSSGVTTNTTFAGAGEIQIGRSVAANGPEDFEIRATEVASGPAQQHTVAVPVRVVNDGSANIDGVIRSERHNDAAITGLTVLNSLNVEAGATVQTVSSNQTRLTIGSVTLGANSGIDSTNSASVFLGNIVGGANAIRFSGSAQARITGNVTASQIDVTGAGIDFDAGVGNTSVVNAPMALSGLLSVRTGSLDLGTNVITGAAPQVVAGLRENKTAGAFDETTANFSNEVKLGPVLAQIAANIGWGEQQTATYTGQIFIPDNGTAGDGLGTVAFAKWFDDNAKVVIDGTTILRNQTFNDGVANASANLSEGWHDIEIRLGQGTGGSGPVLQDGNVNNLGLGIDITTPVSTQTGGGVGLIVDGSHYVNPLDNGSMNLFRTTTVKSAINLSPNTSLTAGGFTTIGAVNLGGGVSQLSITGTGASDADSIAIPASSTASILILQPGASLTTGSLAAFSSVAKAGDGTLNVTSGHNLANGTTFVIGNGIVNLQGPGSGGGAVQLDDGILNITGSVLGAVTVNSGILAGDGASPTTGAIGGLTDLLGGNIAPNLGGPGRMLLNGGVNFGGAGFGLDLNGTTAGTGYDQLNVTGPVTLASNTPLTISLGFQPAVGSLFTIVLNDGVDAFGGLGLFTYDGTPLAEGDHFLVSPVHEFSISYVGGDGNDAVLSYVVPEPGSAALLLGGLGSMLMVRRRRRA